MILKFQDKKVNILYPRSVLSYYRPTVSYQETFAGLDTAV